MDEAVAGPPPVSHRDRRGGLIALGVLHLLLGAFCALMVPMMTIALVAATVTDGSLGASVSPRLMLPALFFYAALAFWFITMGIGSIRCRRWARALILVCSWIWLVSGVGGLGFMLWFYAPGGGLPNTATPGVPAVVATIVGIVTLVVMAVLYVVVPGLFVLFYGRANVRATCERRDPTTRWTDRCPLPVLFRPAAAGAGGRRRSAADPGGPRRGGVGRLPASPGGVVGRGGPRRGVDPLREPDLCPGGPDGHVRTHGPAGSTVGDPAADDGRA
jgi:hypothetical protein